MKKYHCLWIVFLGMFVNVSAQNIKGYYTRLDFDDAGFTGKYADIVVELPEKGKFIFSREFSYQPYWEPVGGKRFLVNRLIPRKGDGPDVRPDKNNICSNAAIVERTDTSITVHWRYAPDITKSSFVDFRNAYNNYGNPSFFYAEYADEYYTINIDGSVKRIAKNGCYKLQEWEDSNNHFLQIIKLTPEGIEQVVLKQPFLSESYNSPIIGKDIKKIDTTGAILYFNFDESHGNTNQMVADVVTDSKFPVSGVHAYWEKGVSGTALLFDSYSNSIKIPADKVPELKDHFSISVWIAPKEYPLNIAAFIDYMKENEGYFLGMNRLGEIEFTVGNGSETVMVKTTELPLYKWTNVVSTYNKSEGLKIYLNGELSVQKKTEIKLKDANTDLFVGMTKSFEQFPFGTERSITKGFKTNMVFSGLIDELIVFNSDVSGTIIKLYYEELKPEELQYFYPHTLPAGDSYKNEFGANYTKLTYNKTWDGLWRVGQYADIVVNFENRPWRYVFWRGTRYLPSLVTDYGRSGIWSNDQSPEAAKCCFEHMSDMLCRYSNIRLIASSPARVIVHWRNASASIEYKWPRLNEMGQGIWTDEYWTIYPDGTSVRHQLLHNSSLERIIEMNQNEILLHPGQKPEDAIFNDAIYLGDENGEIETRIKLNGSLDKKNNRVRKNLLYTNLNSSTKQFQIGEIGTNIETNLHEDVWWNGWNHYPVQLIPSDGTMAIKYDRPVSFCTSTFREFRHQVNEETIEAMQIYGLTYLKPANLHSLNRSWNFSPKMTAISGCTPLEYNKGEKAYYLRQEAEIMEFEIHATPHSPLVNPAFVIKNFNGNINTIVVRINDSIIKCKKGTELDTDGNLMLILWLEFTSDKLNEFKIEQDYSLNNVSKQNLKKSHE